MPRAKRVTRKKKEPLRQAFINYFLYGTPPSSNTKIDGALSCFLIKDDPEMIDIYYEHREEILEIWRSGNNKGKPYFENVVSNNS